MMARNTITPRMPQNRTRCWYCRGIAKQSEDQRDDEDVVHRQRLLDHEAGVVVHAALHAHVPPDPGAEGQRHADVARRQQQAFAHPDLVIVLVQNAQVEGQQRDDDANEGEPDPGGLAQEVGRNEGNQGVHWRALNDSGDECLLEDIEVHQSLVTPRLSNPWRALQTRTRDGAVR
jgi:hypothetical protein